jgi:hypothetical protein
MRYTRLRRQIESGTLIGTHGTPFLSSSPHPEKQGKRKRVDGAKGEEESEEEIGVKRELWKKEGKESKVKEETGSEFESSGSESEGWDSDDEVPLAKLRKAKLGLSSGAATRAYALSNGAVQGPGGVSQPQIVQLQGMVGCGVTAGSSAFQSMLSVAAVPRCAPTVEGREWEGMIPVGNVGIDPSYAAYDGWGSGFQSGIGSWNQGLQATSGKPRKSV